MSADLSGAALWQRGCERLAAELPEQQFNTWIRALEANSDEEASSLALVAPNLFVLQ